MRKVELNMQERYKYDVIKSCSEGKVTKKFCEIKLGVSRRTVDRLLLQYRTSGKAGFIHGNRNRAPVTKKTEQLRNDILLLHQNKYYDSNFSHFTELLTECEGIIVSESFVRSVFRQNNILPSKAWRSTKRAETARLKALACDANATKKARDDAQTKLIDFRDAHPRRERCANFG
ncbi:MAG: hypothetical protein RSE52_05100, partial [Erysipelotrichaceae bacterium]